jgi:hypothetical protein
LHKNAINACSYFLCESYYKIFFKPLCFSISEFICWKPLNL